MKDENMNEYIALFLIFAFGLPLICIFLVKNFMIFQSGMPGFILYGIEAMTPKLGALMEKPNCFYLNKAHIKM